MFSQRLRLARKRAGLSMRELADIMVPKVTAQSISKYEANKMLPSSSVLVGLGKALDVSLDFLMSGRVEELDCVEFRKHSGASARDRAEAEVIVIDRLEHYIAIEHILNISADMNWVEIRRYDSVASEAQIEEKANNLRDAWQLGRDPIPSLSKLLEDKGIKVVEVDLPERINGLSCHALRGGEIVAEAIMVSSHMTIERKRFTLAHELAHKIIRSTGNPAIKIEVAMDRFAGAFLVPNQALQDEIGNDRHRITYYEIMHLKHIYGVSAATILMRLGQIGALSSDVVKRAFATFARSWRKLEPDPIDESHGFPFFEKPSRFKRLVSRALGEELISPVRAAGLLDQSLESVEQQIRGPKHQ